VAGLRGAPYAAPYSASKHGLIGLSSSLAAEFARTNLTVNAICPSFVDTPMVDETVARIARVSKRDEEQSREAIKAMNKHGKLVHPDAVATMILTLCLPQSQDVNGAAIPIDGGTTA
jgi:3-hydroxybutyrate dehydrogenase